MCTDDVFTKAYALRPLGIDPHYACDVNKLERVQRCAARFCKGDYRWTASVSAMIEDLNWDSLALRRQQTRLTTMYKISHNLIEVDKAKFINPASEQRTRGTHNFKTKHYVHA